MKSRQRHFTLGIIIGAVTVILMRALLSSIPGYDNDSNLLVGIFAVLAYGVGTMVLGEILMAFDRNKQTKK